MEGGDLDGFINHFELLVHHAGYRPDKFLVLQKFTDGLPFGMYKAIYEVDNPPVTYQGWRDTALQKQKKRVHMKGHLNMFKSPKPWVPSKPTWGNQHNIFQPPLDQYAMDTSPGHVKAWVTEISDYMPGGNHWHQSVNNWANRPNKFQPKGPREVFVIFVETWGTSLAIAHRNHPQIYKVPGSDKDNNARNKDPAMPDKTRWMKRNNRQMYKQYVTITPQKNKPKHGSPTSLTKTRK